MKKIITIILASLMLFTVVMGGCKQNPSTPVNEIVYEEGVTYSDEIGTYDVANFKEIETVYNKNIFYRNDIIAPAPDPHVLYCSDRTNEECFDWYFLYGTTGSGGGNFSVYKSKDLVSWEPAGMGYTWPENGWQDDRAWAPEVVWDPEADRADYGIDDENLYGSAGVGVYFMFASAIPDDAHTYLTDRGSNKQYGLDLAVATNPCGPFKAWTGVEKGATIAGHDFGTQEGYAATFAYANNAYVDYSQCGSYVGRSGNEVSYDDPWFNGPAARASMDFQYANKDKAGQWLDPDGNVVPEGTEGATYVNENAAWMRLTVGGLDEGDGLFSPIDPSPFIDPVTGQKYLFFTRDGSGTLYRVMGDDGRYLFYGTTIYMAKMYNNDWAQIDYSSITRVSRTQSNYVSDEARTAYVEDAQEFAANIDYNAMPYAHAEVESEIPAFGPGSVEDRIKPMNSINEGTQVQYNPESGLYYLTFSMGSYGDDTYTVIQCVSYNVTGPYRKLEVGEGGLMLGTDAGKALDNISGPGHHTMIEIYDEDLNREKELVIVYHKHIDMFVGGGHRGTCVDRVEWVKNEKGMLVMHVNGPTTFIQPRLYSTGETPYDNLVSYDTTTLTIDNPDAVTDADHAVDKLYDNIIAVHSEDDEVSVINDTVIPAVEPYIHEFQTTAKNVNITINFGEYKDVVAFMIYNSRDYNKSFRSYEYVNDEGNTVMYNEVRRVEMDVKKDGQTATVVFKGIEFYTEMCMFADRGMPRLRPGGAATAVFSEIAVKEIRMRIMNPYHPESRADGMPVYNHDSDGDGVLDSSVLALSEIVVLGRPGSSAANN